MSATPNPTSISLREATAEDHEFLFELYASTRQEELAAWGWNTQQKEMFLRMQFTAVEKRYLAESPNTDQRIILLVGSEIGRIIVIRSPGEIRLADIALLPEHRGRGIGGALIKDLQLEAKNAGLPLRLHVAHGNRAARLYERMGFVQTEDIGSHIRMEWRDTREENL